MHAVLPHQTEVLPGERELVKFDLEVAAHSFNVHYYKNILKIDSKDPQLPHDMKGRGNKLAPEVIVKLALQFLENGDKLYQDEIMQGVKLHRQGQYHHIMWENPSQNVPEDSRKLSAVDAICSMIEPLESRKYRGRVRSWEEVKGSIAANSAFHQIPWMEYAWREMRKIKQPNLKEITSISKIPKEGISREVYDAITGRFHEALRELEKTHGYTFYKNSESIIREILK